MDFSEFLQPGLFGLTGKPGSGKSYFATRIIVEEIKAGNRTIVTNVPLNRDKLRELVGKDFYAYNLETFTDNKHFFTHRGSYHVKLPDGADQENLDFTEHLEDDDNGVLYVIDESHLYFNSRNWKHMSQATLSYITFIRHIGDSLIWMCQNYGDIDKQFRGKTQAFHLLRNLNRERVGFFKRGTGFKCFQYLEEAHIEQRGKMGERQNQDFSYPFQMKYAECYNTSLFNKTHDKKFTVKGIPIKYPFGVILVLFVCFLYWISQGGIWQALAYVLPSSMGEKSREITKTHETSKVVEISGAKIDMPDDTKIITLTKQNSFIEEDIEMVDLEVPFLVFKGFPAPNTQVTKKEAERLSNYFFGVRRYCTLTFITEKESSTKDFNLSIDALFTEFSVSNSVKIKASAGRYEITSTLFQSFIRFLREKGSGDSVKTVRFILKENVPFQMTQGFEIPLQSSTAVQGVVQTNFQYKQIGFRLDLVMESVQGGELVSCKVENKELMDATAVVPIMQNFTNSNVFEVENGMTYEIADYESTEKDETKGFMSKRSISRLLRNKVFLTYGE